MHESQSATLNALIHGKKQPVTYRHLSSLLSLPPRASQALLHDYLTSQTPGTVRAIWCITTVQNSIKRTTLTTTPPSESLNAHLWAVTPPTTADTPTTPHLLLHDDRLRELRLAVAPTHLSNELRDGTFNRLRSPTARWTPASTVAQPAPASKGVPAPLGSSLLASAKARVKAKTKPKGPPKRDTANGLSKRTSSSRPASRPSPRDGEARPVGLFGSRPLGAAAAARMKGADGEGGRESAAGAGTGTGAKKGRRVVEDESDDEEHDENVRAMEREAAEAEAADAARDAEREELQREVADLARQHEEEEEEEDGDGPESPVMKELDVEGEKENGGPGRRSPDRTPDSAKRKFFETYGGLQGSGRRLKKVQLREKDEKGYEVIRIVEKWFDAEGNELPDVVKPEDMPVQTPPVKKKPGLWPNSQNGKSAAKSKPSVKKSKSKGKDTSRTPAKISSTKKKVKGNIMSYFDKKN